jgi:hypothetical protein
MIYLKTIISAPNEIKYLKLNLRESFSHIDTFIICEYNRTHTGIEKEYIFEKYLDQFSNEERDKIQYIKGDISHIVDQSKNVNAAHDNERLMRGYFVKEINLNANDIIFSVDADEIIFEESYSLILKKLKYPWVKSVRLPMFQFFYRVNYLWENLIVKSAIACKAKCFMTEYPAQWRDKGIILQKTVGCHFSWCLTIDEMLSKLQFYAHSYDYGHLAQREILENAIKNRTYPFDRKVDFQIRKLNIHIDREYYPKSIFNMLSEFDHLIY